MIPKESKTRRGRSVYKWRKESERLVELEGTLVKISRGGGGGMCHEVTKQFL